MLKAENFFYEPVSISSAACHLLFLGAVQETKEVQDKP